MNTVTMAVAFPEPARQEQWRAELIAAPIVQRGGEADLSPHALTTRRVLESILAIEAEYANDLAGLRDAGR